MSARPGSDRRGRAARGVVAAIMALVGLSVTLTAAATAGGVWVPHPGEQWQVQLQGNVRTNLCAVPYAGGPCVRPNVYDIDLYAKNGVTLNSAAVSAIHAAGGRAVCYVDAGTWEDWRPDANAYPANVLGLPDGWPGERWLDITATSVLLPIVDARVSKCAAAGFDAVDFDNVDGYTNDTGFALTASDQLTFNTDLAAIAHEHGLSVGLKNDLGQLSALQSTFDFAVNEQCAQYKECAAYDGWTGVGKAVVEIEYSGRPGRYCADAALNGRDAIHKSRALNADPWRPCS
jgi:hypothetical protein